VFHTKSALSRTLQILRPAPALQMFAGSLGRGLTAWTAQTQATRLASSGSCAGCRRGGGSCLSATPHPLISIAIGRLRRRESSGNRR